jgi:glucose-6-phosphate 1-dehydrogenase
MDFSHETNEFNTPESYEILLGDVMNADQTLFTDWEGLRESWRIVDALRTMAPKAPEKYVAGTHGPANGLALLKADNRDWLGNQEISVSNGSRGQGSR